MRGTPFGGSHEKLTMHEQSLMRNLLDQVNAIAVEQGCLEIANIQIEVGAMSGVEPQLLAGAFEHLATDPMFERTELMIDVVAVEAECKACAHRFFVEEFRFGCPMCDGKVRVLCGDQCELVSVSFYQQESA